MRATSRSSFLIAAVATVAAACTDGPDDPPAPLFAAPIAGATGGAIGVVGNLDQRLYWHLTIDGQSAIASGPLEGGDAELVVPPGPAITAFDARGRVIYQTADGLFHLPQEGGAPQRLAGAPACSAVTTGGDGQVFCRTAATGEILAWSVPSGAGPTVRVAGVPPGDDLTYGTYGSVSGLYFSTIGTGTPSTGQVLRLPDGAAEPEPFVSEQLDPASVVVGGNNAPAARLEVVAWLQHTAAGVSVHAEAAGRRELLPPTPGLFTLAARRMDNPSVWAASPTTLWVLDPHGGPPQSSSPAGGIGGLAVTSVGGGWVTAVYWTALDGSVHTR